MIATPRTSNTSMNIRIAKTREDLGKEAAIDIAETIRTRLKTQPHLRVIFAAAPSQREMLQALIEQPEIPWNRISAFHMDEYIGLPANAPQGFGMWLRAAIFDHVPFASFDLIQPGNDLEATCRDYAHRLMERPIDLVLLGIGANGHLAFNDPGVADFKDPLAVKVVPLDAVCRLQQTAEGWFGTPEQVRERLHEMIGMGANHLLLNPVSHHAEQLEALAEVVGLG